MANSTPTFTRKGASFAHKDLQGVTLCDLGAIDTSLTIDCSEAKLFYASSVTGTITITVANVPVGGEVILNLVSHGTPPTATWSGVNSWLGAAAPTWEASKYTQVRLVNDGHEVVGSFIEEYHSS